MAGGETAVLVVGGGAIGGVIAALLEGTVGRVVVLDPAAEHVARMRDPGLRVGLDGGERVVRVVRLDARARAQELDEDFDLALVTVKAAHLEAALTPLAAAGVARAYVSLGNGLVHDRIGALVGEDRLIVGVVEWGATNLGPGRVARTSPGGFVVGEPDGRVRDRTRLLAGVLAAVGPVKMSENAVGTVWSKLLVNSTMSALGAASGLLTGEVLADADGRRAAVGLWREGCAVAAASGVRLEPVWGEDPVALVAGDDAGARLQRTFAPVAGTKASMLQDLERGARPEVAVINGAVAARAGELGVPAPLNARVAEIIEAIARGERAGGRDVFVTIARRRET
ncbi:ketopantoate reductase family protein [Capillimicrobium parvum]|uniref:2-dehydropantoate 2-reductase n=1 Tax=Capillimicrobium parvum TaxID=2884022 RepID=A0A9E7BXY6_9ACTN|nr:2-dehydropantoate 2-reductase [Capillimicrobium parvum]UGS34231.1 hypothetical protein DSM104329_00604 [Capillimicrobium parvum]